MSPSERNAGHFGVRRQAGRDTALATGKRETMQVRTPVTLQPEIPSESGVALRFPTHSKAPGVPLSALVILKTGFTFLLLASLAAIVPSPARAADAPAGKSGKALSPFGIGACNQTSQELSKWIPQMSAIGIGNLRACRTSFGDVEPEEGKWTWTRLDEQLAYGEAQHMEFFGLLLGSPRWNTKDAPGRLPVNNLPAWSEYVSKIVEHAKGRIRFWEVWNEPPNFTGRDQTPEDYAKIVVSAYDAAKAADSSCLVGLAAKSVHVNYLEQVLKAGAKDHFDYITLHPYEVLGTVINNAGTEPVFMNIVPLIRKMLAVQNPAKADVPIFFTEIGTDTKKGVDIQGHALVKAYTMGIAQGVVCINWFEGMDGDSGPMGLLERSGHARPAYKAMATLIEHLGAQPKYLGWVLLNKRHYGFVFEGPKTTALVTWASRGVPDVVDFGTTVPIANPLTGNIAKASSYELSSAPVLVLGVPEKIVEQARANKAQPLPWGEDEPSATSISVTMGEKNIEKGLHTLAGESVAADVIAYGGSARAGGVPGGNLFVVNPNFLSYTSEPIEITAVVRRNPANDNAGFKLVYESASGFKTAGTWFTVPDNKQWHTVRWKISDAQFVNYWGYNFALESDGNKFNKYYLQSVTVTKLTK